MSVDPRCASQWGKVRAVTTAGRCGVEIALGSNPRAPRRALRDRITTSCASVHGPLVAQALKPQSLPGKGGAAAGRARPPRVGKHRVPAAHRTARRAPSRGPRASQNRGLGSASVRDCCVASAKRLGFLVTAVGGALLKSLPAPKADKADKAARAGCVAVMRPLSLTRNAPKAGTRLLRVA